MTPAFQLEHRHPRATDDRQSERLPPALLGVDALMAVVIEQVSHRQEVVRVMKPAAPHSDGVTAVDDVVQRALIAAVSTAHPAEPEVPPIDQVPHPLRDRKGLTLC